MSGREDIFDRLHRVEAENAALVAERDDWKHKASGEYNQLIQREYDRVVAERDRYERALKRLDGELPAVLASSHRIISEALAGEAG